VALAAAEPAFTPRPGAGRTLAVAGLVHALHDGFTSSIYVLLPVWQAQFGFSYSALAMIRALYIGALAGLQIPSSRLGRWLGIRAVLTIGTLLATAGFVLSGASAGIVGLGAALMLAGAGSSTQHPLASSAISRVYGEAARGPLGTYNFAGDLGKATLPPALALLLGVLDWRSALWALAGLGAAVALLVVWMMPPLANVRTKSETPSTSAAPQTHHSGAGIGFNLLIAIGVLDSAVGVGLLLFLPALLQFKGGTAAGLGLALSLLFVGGACGKFACGWLGARFGILATVIATEVGTAAAILALLVLPLVPGLALLPVLGVMLNGTSSVLYGTVPELAPAQRIEHAFAVFYSCTLGSSALAPVLYGWLGDAVGPHWSVAAAATTALAVVPLVIQLSPRLAPSRPAARN
jgi:FSR family fosmidomycin resistance protein-like MFS transporter